MTAIIARPRTSKSLLTRALQRALLYMGICSAYIVYSSRWAASSAATAAEIERFEVTKGVLFVVVTGILFFLISLVYLKRVERRDQLLIAGERRDVASHCSAALAHDVNNLLMSLSGLTDELRRHPAADAEIHPLLNELEHTMTGLSSLAKRLAVAATRVSSHSRQRMDIAERLPPLCSLAAKHPAMKTCELITDPLPSATVELDPELLEQGVLNLIINAAQATPPHAGRVAVAARIEGNQLVLEVHDNGPGVRPEQVDDILSPGFTTKPDGSGLGLLTVQTLICECRGNLEIARSERLGGALFRLKIPLAKGT
jgi:signal transduction histidine kinase